MNTSKSRPLAKVFWPVMLLTAALSLPVDSQAAPSPKARHEHSEQANKGQGKKQDKKQERKQDNKADRQVHQDRQDRGRHQGADRAGQQRAQAQQRVEQQRLQAAQRRQAELQRKAQSQRQTQLQQQRKLELQRKANLQRQAELQRQTELQRRANLQRQAELQRRTSAQRSAVSRDRRDRQVGYLNGNAGRYRYYDRNNDRYYESRYGRGETIVVDGYLTNDGRSCQALRDDNGELYMLVGNTYGLRTGDHTRVTGQVVDGGACDWEGTAFQITDVKALWADRRHQSTYYHHQYDGESFGSRNNWMGRRPRAFENRIERYGYYDRDQNRYDDRYRSDDRNDRYDDGRNGNRQLIIREGRLYNDRGCALLDTGNDTFGLTGNVGGHRNGDDVKVTGFLEGPSRCADKTIRIGEIR
jgi:hypothetical protein